MKLSNKKILGLAMSILIVLLTACGTKTGNNDMDEIKETSPNSASIDSNTGNTNNIYANGEDKAGVLSGNNEVKDLDYQFDGEVAVYEARHDGEIIMRYYVAHRGDTVTGLGVVTVGKYEDLGIDPNDKDQMKDIENILALNLLGGKAGFKVDLKKYENHYEYILIMDFRNLDPEEAGLYTEVPEITNFDEFSKNLQEDLEVIRVR